MFNEDSPEVYLGSIAKKNHRRKLETMEELNPFAALSLSRNES